jgi:hypothetical protein
VQNLYIYKKTPFFFNHEERHRLIKKLDQGLFISWKVVFRKLLSKLFCICLLLKKLVNRKHFLVQKQFSLVSRKAFSFYFRWKTIFRSCEKIKNVMLFANYIKFGPQTFDCYIFWFKSFFLISPLKIWFDLIFYINFGFFIIVICFSLIIFLIEIFYLSNLILILLILIYFI